MRSRRVAGIALIAIGLVLMTWPILIGVYAQVSQAALSRRFADEELAAGSARPGSAESPDSTGGASVSSADAPAAGQDMRGASAVENAGGPARRAEVSSIGPSGSADVLGDFTSGPLGHLTSPEALAAAATDTGGEPIARIRIPRIGLDAIVVEGADNAALHTGPGHLPTTAPPGGPGTCAIAAHRDRWFERLPEVQTGDPVVLETPDYRFEYAVSTRKVVTPDRGDLLASGPDPTLTLITCTGAGYPHSLYRLLVFCQLRRSTPR